MRKRDQASLDAASLDELVEEITVDANGEDEQLWAFRQAFEDNISVPCEATVIGESVKVMKFDYDGNNRRGLTAMCRRADGTNYIVAASDLVIPLSASGGRYLAAYRKWMGLSPFPRGTRGRTVQRTAAAPPDLEGPIELVVLSVKQKSARCRLLGGDRTFTFRAGRLWDLVPGEIAVVRPAKQWVYAGNPYLSGVIESTRLDARALRLVPLRLEERGLWNPAEHYWGEEGEPIEDWAKPIIARGPRPEFEMEQVLPGADSDDPFSDPIGESNDRKDSGDQEGAHKLLMDLCHTDLRCLDAHSHLGNFVFDHRPQGRNSSLRGGVSNRRIISRRRVPWRTAVGLDRQPAFPTMHEWLRAMPLAPRPFRRGWERFRSHALAESVRQSGRALPDRSRAGESPMGR